MLTFVDIQPLAMKYEFDGLKSKDYLISHSGLSPSYGEFSVWREGLVKFGCLRPLSGAAH